MVELRQSPLTGDWVIIAPRRSGRPYIHARAILGASGDESECPFCGGNEHMTPPELAIVRAPAGSPYYWSVRVVPNKYPALSDGAPVARADEFYSNLAAHGRHEVIIHTPEHGRAVALMRPAEISTVLGVYRDRILAASDDKRIKSVVMIINHGAKAGASIDHPHSQLFALPVVAPSIEREQRTLAAHSEAAGTCLICEMILRERSRGGRVVDENERFIAFCPYASRAPYEIFFAPKDHRADFTEFEFEEVGPAAELLRSVLARLRDRLDDPPYNAYLHTRPLHSPKDYHWHLVVMPNMSVIAGFELGSGIMINTVEPEAAAAKLR